MKLKTFWLSALSLGSLQADIGLIGGQAGDSSAYAAFVNSTNGQLTTITGLPPTTAVIEWVGINNSGNGIVGGVDNNGNAYATFVNGNGTLTAIPINMPGGVIDGVAINNSGNGLIGGQINGGYYVATVLPNGMPTPLTISSTPIIINSVALNDAGVGLIGGEGNVMDSLAEFAGYVSSGTVTTLATPMTPGSHIYSVAINSSGNGIIGGILGDFAYGALTTAGQTSVIPLTNIPATAGSYLVSVAINNAGLGLVGGADSNGNIFAGYAAATTGVVTPLFMSPPPGFIMSVAINTSGNGLIGGGDNGNAYAALVTPTGGVNPLFSSPFAGQINSVAYDDNGIGLIVGIDMQSPYAALVAPNGALTPLDVSALDLLNSAALGATPAPSPTPIPTILTPKSIGSFNSIFYTQLTIAAPVLNRLIQLNPLWEESFQTPIAQRETEDERIASSNTMLASIPMYTPKKCSPPTPSPTPPPPEKKNAIWVAPFGDYVHLHGHRSFPGVKNKIGGVLVGYDRKEKKFIVGGALGYGHNSLHYSEGLGHGTIQEELGCLYGAYYRKHFWFDAVLWGGFFQFSNVRKAPPFTTSHYKTHGWILSPHVEFASPWEIGQTGLYFVEPFVMFDWVNAWQHSFTEHGSSGFNLMMKSLYGSLLQSEAGLRFYEKFPYSWGDFLLEEKVSYINQTPFLKKNVTTAFVASAATFPIAIGSTEEQNLGCLGLMGTFVPKNKVYPFGGIALQVAAGSSYQTYFASLFFGWDF